MPNLTTNDGCGICYEDTGGKAPPLILIHGFTGSSAVFKRNVPALSQVYRVIAPDLRGHGNSEKPDAGYHVFRLAMDLKNLIDHLNLPEGNIRVIAGSLGCAIIWSYAELFTTSAFSHVVFVDQSPLQNYTSDGTWGIEHGNKSCNSAAALAHIQATLSYRPEDVYNGTIMSCLAYLSHPLPTDKISPLTMREDVDFFLNIALKGDGPWFGKLMADHTSLDWRGSIRNTFGGRNSSHTRVLVVASNRSGCFPPAGPLHVVDLVNSETVNLASTPPAERRAQGLVIDWGGHWCYYEDPEKFNALALEFLDLPALA